MKQLLYLLLFVSLVPFSSEAFSQVKKVYSFDPPEFQFDFDDLSNWLKTQSRNEKKNIKRLRMLALAALSYESANQSFPCDSQRDGKLPGWRMLLAKELERLDRNRPKKNSLITDLDDVIGDNEYTTVTREIISNQPWNSDLNLRLADKMPAIFGSDNMPDIFAVYDRVSSMGSIADGTANTIALIHLPPQKLNWLKRQPIWPEQVIEVVKRLKDDECLLAAFYNGRVIRITNSVDESTLRNLLHKSDGQKIEWWKLDNKNQAPKRNAVALAEHKKVAALIDAGEWEKSLAILKKIPAADKETDVNTYWLFVRVYQDQISRRASSGSDFESKQAIQLSRMRMSHYVQKILRLDPSNATALRIAAESAFERKHYLPSLEYYKKLLKSDPSLYNKVYEINNILGKTSDNEAMLEEAGADLRSRLEQQLLDSNVEPDLPTELANCFCLRGDFDGGIEYLTTKLTENSGNTKIASSLKAASSILYSQRAVENKATTSSDFKKKRLSDLAKALEYDRQNIVALNLATELGFDSDVGGAARKLYDPRKTNVQDLPESTLSILGHHELLNKNYTESIELLELAISKDSSSNDSFADLASAYMEVGKKLERALELIDRSIEVESKTPMGGKKTAQLFLTKSEILSKLDKPEEVGKTLQNAYRFDPSNTIILSKLFIFFEPKNPRQAEGYLRQLNKIQRESNRRP